MTDDKNRLLVKLLREYQAELLDKDVSNQKARDEKRWNDIQAGIKAQYNHARIIADKLDAEVAENIRGWW